jgi:DNA-binding transcriptional LysR family regulator
MTAHDPLRIFTRVAELGSFTQAALSLGMAKTNASHAVRQLEARLGTRLLQRTTRRVQLTQDGQLFYERCKDVLDDLEELHGLFQHDGTQPLRGRVRLDMTTITARSLVIPRLPELLAEHPGLELEISATERRVDLVREGFDCVLRAGPLADNALVARPLGRMTMVNCASPDYLARHGTPRALADLARHRLVHYVPTLGGKSAGFEYVEDGEDRRIAMAGAITVNNAESYAAACMAGLGLIQAPLMGLREHLSSGRMVQVLPEHRARAMPLSLVYPHRRQLPRRVRVVMDWLAAVLAPQLEAASPSAPG